jgi:hypothetical protein
MMVGSQGKIKMVKEVMVVPGLFILVTMANTLIISFYSFQGV